MHRPRAVRHLRREEPSDCRRGIAAVQGQQYQCGIERIRLVARAKPPTAGRMLRAEQERTVGRRVLRRNSAEPTGHGIDVARFLQRAQPRERRLPRCESRGLPDEEIDHGRGVAHARRGRVGEASVAPLPRQQPVQPLRQVDERGAGAARWWQHAARIGDAGRGRIWKHLDDGLAAGQDQHPGGERFADVVDGPELRAVGLFAWPYQIDECDLELFLRRGGIRDAFSFRRNHLVDRDDPRGAAERDAQFGESRGIAGGALDQEGRRDLAAIEHAHRIEIERAVETARSAGRGERAIAVIAPVVAVQDRVVALKEEAPMRAIATEQRSVHRPIGILEAHVGSPPVRDFVGEDVQRALELRVGRVRGQHRERTHVDVALEASGAAPLRALVELLEPDALHVVLDLVVAPANARPFLVAPEVVGETGETDDEVVVVVVEAKEFPGDGLPDGPFLRAVRRGQFVVVAGQRHHRDPLAVFKRARRHGRRLSGRVSRQRQERDHESDDQPKADFHVTLVRVSSAAA